jgi:Fe-S-cluster containining protein
MQDVGQEQHCLACCCSNEGSIVLHATDPSELERHMGAPASLKISNVPESGEVFLALR